MKKVAVIQDLSSFGKCSLTAAIPVLSVMGSQACPLPTAILSAQTAYPSFYSRDLTADISKFSTQWEKQGERFDGIQTGFVTGEQQIQHIFQFLSKFYKEETKLLVDPVMGDDGELYKMFSNELLMQMRELVKSADMITPNLTECCLLTGISYEKINRFKEEVSYIEAITEAGQILHQNTNAQIIITGVITQSENQQQIGNLYIGQQESYYSKKEFNGVSYSGTGDLFSSVIMGGLMRGQRVKESMQLAELFLSKAIEATSLADTKPIEGIQFEKYLKMLL